jgi:uncharacterized protein (TIGR02246 family)
MAAALTLADWLAEYGRAWREADPDGAIALFAEDAVYRSHTSREPHRGRDGIRVYWTEATSDQADVDVQFGVPIVADGRAAVEWWATMRVAGEELTLPGCLVLRFDEDGLCEELREYWFVEPGRRPPPEGWGG